MRAAIAQTGENIFAFRIWQQMAGNNRKTRGYGMQLWRNILASFAQQRNICCAQRQWRIGGNAAGECSQVMAYGATSWRHEQQQQRSGGRP